MTLLTICIPTYNFGAYISVMLDSLLRQITDDIEILVFDGASVDDTSDEVLSRKKYFPNLQYYKQSFRGGIDRDIDRAVHLARGRYCWILSADDIVLPGSINTILSCLKNGYELYICEHSIYRASIEDAKPYPIFRDMHSPYLYDMSSRDDIHKYFQSALTSEAYLTFLSTPIFKKELWIRSRVNEEVYGKCWIVAARLLPAIFNGVKIYHMNKTLLSKSSLNKSYIYSNLVSQFRILMINLPKVVDLCAPKNHICHKELRRILRAEVPIKFLLRTKLEASNSKSEKNEFLASICYIYLDGNVLGLFKKLVILYIPHSFLRSIERIYKLLK